MKVPPTLPAGQTPLEVQQPASRSPALDSNSPERLARLVAKVAPQRITVGLPGLGTVTQSRAPKRPGNFQAAVTASPLSNRMMAAPRHDAAVLRADMAMGQLYPMPTSEQSQSTRPDVLSSMSSAAGYHEAVNSMFGTEAGDGALARRLLAAVPPKADGPTRLLAPLVLATALKAVGATTQEQVGNLLDSAQRGEHSPELFRLERTLAATAAGTQALGHLRGMHESPAQLEVKRDGLNLCAELERKGVALDQHGSVDDVVKALNAMPEANIEAPIGHDNDAPLQLLAKATRHVGSLNEQMKKSEPPAPGDQAAYVAWKKGGFVESGKGSDFNNMIGRLHKFMTYVDRAEHGPRTLGGLAQDAYAHFGRAVGVGKSPLSPMRYGTLGGDAGLAHEEAAKAKQSLHRALSVAVDHLVEELGDLKTLKVESKHNQQLARAAVFDLWKQTGETTHAESDVVARARQLMAQAGSPLQPKDEAALKQCVAKFTRKARTDSGAPAIRVGVRALETLFTSRPGDRATGKIAATDPQNVGEKIQQLRALPTRSLQQQTQLEALQSQRVKVFKELMVDMRSAEQGGGQSKPLFKFSDLKTLLRGTPREGPTAADAQHVMQALAGAKRISASTFSDGASHGVGTFGALALRAGSAIGTPLIYPVLKAESGKRATVSIGNSPTGGRLFIGTETSKSGTVGVGAGWAAPPLASHLASAAVLAEVTATRGVSQAEGAVITGRKDQPGWEKTVPQVVDFLFDQAHLKAGAGRAENSGELWSRFAQRFADDPHLAVGWVGDSAAATGAKVSASATARVKTGAKSSIGPALSVALNVDRTQLHRTPNAHGGDVPIAVRTRQVGATFSAMVAQSPPMVASASDHVKGWGSATPLVGASMEWNVAGGVGMARLGRSADGQLSASMCQREIQFKDSKQLNEYMNHHRPTWETALVAQDATGKTTPEDAKARLDNFLQQAAASDSGLVLHGERLSLAPQVADQINGFEARLTTLMGSGTHQAAPRELTSTERMECQALQTEVQRLLKSEQSWVPNALISLEQNAVSTTAGLNFGLRVANQEQAKTQHLNAVLLASTPKAS